MHVRFWPKADATRQLDPYPLCARKLTSRLDPISSEELQKITQKIYATPPDVVAQAKQAVIYKAP